MLVSAQQKLGPSLTGKNPQSVFLLSLSFILQCLLAHARTHIPARTQYTHTHSHTSEAKRKGRDYKKVGEDRVCVPRGQCLGRGWQGAQGTEWAGELHGFLSSLASDQRSAPAAQPRAVHPPPSSHVRLGPNPHQHAIVLQGPTLD